MTKRTNIPTNHSTGQPLSGVLNDWIQAICQLQHWYRLLQEALDEKTNTYCLGGPLDDATTTQLIELVRLKERIGCGLSDLEKEIPVTTQETNLALEALKIIEHTQIVLRWCLDIQQRLGLQRF